MNYKLEAKIKTFNINQVGEKIKKNTKEYIELVEKTYNEKVTFTAKEIIKNWKNNQKNIVLIAGPSASGKTTTSHILVSEFEKHNLNAIVISMDNFFVNREDTSKLEDGTYDYDNITSVNVDLFKSTIDDLLEYNKSIMPIYDFVKGVRTDNAYCLEINSPTIIVIEGIHAFNPLIMSNKMISKCNKVYVCANSEFETESGVITCENLRFIRRAIRDFYHRGNTISQTEQLWRYVRDREEKFIIPFKNQADYIIDTVHQFEPFLYKNEMLKIAQSDENILKYLNYYLTDENLDKQFIPKNSLVWEFISKN